jgi:PAS domain S-box-containing protein
MGFRSLLGIFGYRRPPGQPARLLAAIMTSSSDAIASQTLGGIVTSWNPSAERLFGYSKQEMIGQSITRLVPPGRENEERHILAQIAAGIQVAPLRNASDSQRRNGAPGLRKRYTHRQ